MKRIAGIIGAVVIALIGISVWDMSVESDDVSMSELRTAATVTEPNVVDLETANRIFHENLRARLESSRSEFVERVSERVDGRVTHLKEELLQQRVHMREQVEAEAEHNENRPLISSEDVKRRLEATSALIEEEVKGECVAIAGQIGSAIEEVAGDLDMDQASFIDSVENAVTQIGRSRGDSERCFDSIRNLRAGRIGVDVAATVMGFCSVMAFPVEVGVLGTTQLVSEYLENKSLETETRNATLDYMEDVRALIDGEGARSPGARQRYADYAEQAMNRCIDRFLSEIPS